MPPEDTTASTDTRDRKSWSREEATRLVFECEKAEQQGMSEREFAKSRGVPRTTLRHWRARKRMSAADPTLIEFLESPTGLAFLHRLVGALHFEFGQVGPCGVDQIARCLKLAGLSAFVANSHGTHQAIGHSSAGLGGNRHHGRDEVPLGRRDVRAARTGRGWTIRRERLIGRLHHVRPGAWRLGCGRVNCHREWPHEILKLTTL